MRVKIVNKSNHRLPEYATPGSAGMDLKANTTEPIVLKPLERQMDLLQNMVFQLLMPQEPLIKKSFKSIVFCVFS